MTTVAEQIEAIRRGSAALLRPEVRTLRVTGPDRVRFLNGMVTNDVAQLRPGHGMLAVKASNRGRVEGVMRVRARDEALELDLLDVVADKVRRTLDQFIIMDDCAIEDVSGAREVLTVLGPGAARAAGVSATLEPHAFVADGERMVIADATLGLAGFEIHAPAGQGAAALAAAVAGGATPISAEALDIARVEAGTPLDGRDLDEDTIPMEARLERALSLQKGCYVGQEVIARATNLGGVKHILVGLRLEGERVPPAGSRILIAGSGEATGEVTSAVRSPGLGAPIALGFVRRAHEAPGTRIEVEAEDGTPRIAGVVAELPLVR